VALRVLPALDEGAAVPVTVGVAEAGAGVRNRRRTRLPSVITAPPAPSLESPVGRDTCAR